MRNPNYVSYESTGYPESVYQTGNTVRLHALFEDWDNETVAPEVVKVILYTTAFEKLAEYPVTGQLPDGVYFLDFQQETPGSYIYEWYAEIGGTPSLQRGRITFRKL